MRTLALLCVVGAGALLTSGASGARQSDEPLLTYSVSYLLSPSRNEGGLCATDPTGHLFRVSDPQDDREAAWSPDGTMIAFARQASRRPEGNIYDIFITDAEGRHRRNLTRLVGMLNEDPAWSPDGTGSLS